MKYEFFVVVETENIEATGMPRSLRLTEVSVDWL